MHCMISHECGQLLSGAYSRVVYIPTIAIITVALIRGRHLFKGGAYLRKYSILDSIQVARIQRYCLMASAVNNSILLNIAWKQPHRVRNVNAHVHWKYFCMDEVITRAGERKYSLEFESFQSWSRESTDWLKHTVCTYSPKSGPLFVHMHMYTWWLVLKNPATLDYCLPLLSQVWWHILPDIWKWEYEYAISLMLATLEQFQKYREIILLSVQDRQNYWYHAIW